MCISCVATQQQIAVFFCHRVCRHWQNLIACECVWKEIDLSLYDMEINSLEGFGRKRFTSALVSLKFKGCLKCGML